MYNRPRAEAVPTLCDAAGRAMGKDTKGGWRNLNMGQGMVVAVTFCTGLRG